VLTEVVPSLSIITTSVSDEIECSYPSPISRDRSQSVIDLEGLISSIEASSLLIVDYTAQLRRIQTDPDAFDPEDMADGCDVEGLLEDERKTYELEKEIYKAQIAGDTEKMTIFEDFEREFELACQEAWM
jgi:hypothetical protein